MAIDTKPNLSNAKFEQFSGETLSLSGCNEIFGKLTIRSGATLSILPNHGNGKVLTSDTIGNATWQCGGITGLTDNILKYSSVSKAYRPYSGKTEAGTGSASAGRLYLGSVNPTGRTCVLNYDGNFNATNLIAKSGTTRLGDCAGYNSGVDLCQTAVGMCAGVNNVCRNQVAIGICTGFGNCGNEQTAVGYKAGESNCASGQLALGCLSGYFNLGENQIAIGNCSGCLNTGITQLAIGYVAGYANFGGTQIAVGRDSGNFNRGDTQLAVGHDAGCYNSGNTQIAVGFQAGIYNKGVDQIAIGGNAGNLNRCEAQIAIGNVAGYSNKGVDQITIGEYAGCLNSGDTQIAIGCCAGMVNQGCLQIAIGRCAGHSNTGNTQIAIGQFSGCRNKVLDQIAIGNGAGWSNATEEQIAIGTSAGNDTIGGGTQIAIGVGAGACNSGDTQIAIGSGAGIGNHGDYVIGIGRDAACYNTGESVIAIGDGAGCGNATDFLFILEQRNVCIRPLICGDFSTGDVEMYCLTLSSLTGVSTSAIGVDATGKIIKISSGSTSVGMVTGATNLGSGNGTIFTNVTNNKINLKTLSGGTNITLTCNGSYIGINATDTTGINWTGTTANGVGTYVSSTRICSQPNMTFDGTQLRITGNVCATTCVRSPLISGTTVCGLTAVCGGIICATTCFAGDGSGLTGTATSLTVGTAANANCLGGQLPAFYAVKACAVTGATNLGSGNGTIYTTTSANKVNLKSLSGGTNITLTCNANYIAINSIDTTGINWTGITANGVGTYVSASKICSQPNMTFDGTQLKVTGNVCATTCVRSVLVSGTTTCGSTAVCGGILCGSTCVASPVVLGSTYVCSPVITGSTRVCSPIVIGTSCVCSPKFCTTGQMVSTLATGTSPFSVASTTVNTNLNADLLDDVHGSGFTTTALFAVHTGNSSIHYVQSAITITESQVTNLPADLSTLQDQIDALSQIQSTVLYYPAHVSSGVASYERMTTSQLTSSGHTESTTGLNANTVEIDSFITDANQPGVTGISSGLWTFHTHAQWSSVTGVNNLHWDVYKRTTGGTETFLFRTSTPDIGVITLVEYQEAQVFSGTTMNPTDRLVLKIMAQTTGGAKTASIQYGGTVNFAFMQPPITVNSSPQWTSIQNRPAWLTGTTLSAFESAHSHSQYALKTNAVTGATNLGSGNGTIYTTTTSNKVNLKTLSGGTNVTLTCNANYIAINASSSGTITGGANGLSTSGSTIVLGGALTGDTTIGVGTYSLNLSTLNVSMTDGFAIGICNVAMSSGVAAGVGGVAMTNGCTLGTNSVAMGVGSRACAFSSFAQGAAIVCSAATNSVAMTNGYACIGSDSVALNGGITCASSTFAVGVGAIAAGVGSIAIGTCSLATPDCSVSIRGCGGVYLSGLTANVGATCVVYICSDGKLAVGTVTAGSQMTVCTISGNSSSTGFTVNHACNKQFVMVQVVQTASPYATVYTDVQRTNANCVCVTFSTAPASGTNYNVLIIG